MRGRAALLECLTLICLANEARSLQFERHPVLRIVGGSTEDLHPSADDEGKKGSPQPTPTAFLRNPKTETKPKAERKIEHRADEDQEVAPTKKRRPKLNLGMGSSALEKMQTQSSKLLSALGPAAVTFSRLFYPSDGKTLITKPAVYALALLGSSSGFYLFLYFITVGYCGGVTLPVLVALIVYNVSEWCIC